LIDFREGDCLDVLRTLRGLDACVTDPPYGLAFMGRAWDGGVAFQPETWRLVFDAMKPGAHLAAFSGTRTSHRMVCAIEDAGFEIRDSVLWLYGSGFPKSHAVPHVSLIATRQEFDGWGTALKPACEPIVLARKPLIGTVAANVLAHGTGGINVDACRIPAADGDAPVKWDNPRGGIWTTNSDATGRLVPNDAGRWPANVAHDGSDEVMAAFAAFGDTGARAPVHGTEPSPASVGTITNRRARVRGTFHGDIGTPARFYYCAKASKADRAGSKHPTIKPVSLIRWLVRLITPPGGTVLDPFAGSGTTGEAAQLEGMNAVLIEREAEYAADIRRRVSRWTGQDAPLFAEVAD
jgi:site-specific DNA-methyltransferase (adenine-specific)